MIDFKNKTKCMFHAEWLAQVQLEHYLLLYELSLSLANFEAEPCLGVSN